MRPLQFYEDCIVELKLDADKIYECTNGTLGTILQLFAEKESIRALDILQGVPAVTYQNVISPVDFALSLDNFKLVVDQKMQNITAINRMKSVQYDNAELEQE